jgi:hypothetical protein
LSTKPANLDTVSVADARKAEPTIRAPDEAALKELELQNAHDLNKQNLQKGWIGAFMGTGSEKSGNAAIIVIVLCFIFIGCSAGIFKFDKQFDDFFKFLTSMLSIVTLALGYLFGSKST